MVQLHEITYKPTMFARQGHQLPQQLNHPSGLVQ